MPIVALLALLARSAPAPPGAPAARPDAVVAADGSGNYRTVQAAIDAVPQSTSADRRWVILVKKGTYRERVYVQREKRFVTLLGEDPAATVITYNLHAGNEGPDGRPIGTFRTPTVQIDADDFTAESLTFENGAGPVGQALAVRVDGDRVVFRNCRFLGWQDTLFLNRGRQYLEDCVIVGHVDFVFGGATALFERCHLHCWRDGYITAASTPADQRYGFVFRNGRITGESGVKTFLGRPWRDFAQVAFLDTEMAEVVRPAGWDNWSQPQREKTARYAEGGSTGPGADATPRVGWARRLSTSEAATFSIENVLSGWDPGPAPARGSASAGPVVAPGFTIEHVLAELRERYPQVARVPDDLPSGILAREGLEYARRGERLLALDVYRPSGPGPFPAVLIVHGGGWESGDRQMERPFAKRLAARGYVTVPVSYRLGPEGRFPAAVHDLKEAVRWVRSHAAEHGVDPAKIGVVGASAGGHLAAFLGATNGLRDFDGDASVESRVQAVVDIDGPVRFTDPALIALEEGAKGATSRFLGGNHSERAAVWQAASPLTHVDRESAPTLFLNSTATRPILAGREEMAARLRSLGIGTAVVQLPDTPHPFGLVQPWFDRVLDEVDRFLGRHLRGAAGEPRGR